MLATSSGTHTGLTCFRICSGIRPDPHHLDEEFGAELAGDPQRAPEGPFTERRGQAAGMAMKPRPPPGQPARHIWGGDVGDRGPSRPLPDGLGNGDDSK
jgi:hypothetical protein